MFIKSLILQISRRNLHKFLSPKTKLLFYNPYPFFSPRRFRHEGSKARRHTKECSGWFSPQRLEGRKKHEGMQRMVFATNARMNCSPLPLGEWLGVRLFSPRSSKAGRNTKECSFFGALIQDQCIYIHSVTNCKISIQKTKYLYNHYDFFAKTNFIVYKILLPLR